MIGGQGPRNSFSSAGAAHLFNFGGGGGGGLGADSKISG